MESRVLVRLPRAVVALTAALALGAAGCSTLSASTVATVGDVDVPMSALDALMARSSAGYRLSPDQLEIARDAEAAGILDRVALDEALTTLVSTPDSPDLAPAEDLDEDRIPRICAESDGDDCPSDVLDALFEGQRAAAGEGWDTGLDAIGLDESTWRELFTAVATAELAGLYQSGGAPFDLALTTETNNLQTSLVGQLVNAEVARQAHEALGLELDEAEVQAELDRILSQFAGPDAAPEDAMADAEAVLGLSGYDLASFRDLFVATQLREIALQGVQDPAQLEDLDAFFADLEVTVAQRFGTWDEVTRTVAAPERLDGDAGAP